MRITLTCAALALALGSGPAFAQSGEITIWSWNIAASSLKATVAGFNKQFPDVKVTVEDLGNQQTFDKTLGGMRRRRRRAAGHPFHREPRIRDLLEPVPRLLRRSEDARLHRRDRRQVPRFQAHRARSRRQGLCHAVGFRPGRRCSTAATSTKRRASIPQRSRPGTISLPPARRSCEANPGVTMTQADINGDTEFFRMIANEQGCGYFSKRRPVDHGQPAGLRDRA